jgi:hypothetical protein
MWVRDSVTNNNNEAQNKHHAMNDDSEPSIAKESLAGKMFLAKWGVWCTFGMTMLRRSLAFCVAKHLSL